ncbi:nitroreductase family protein [Clostridium sp. LBM24168]
MISYAILIKNISCRKYQQKQIRKEELDVILEAGTYAPTGMGKQSPIIVVIQD